MKVVTDSGKRVYRQGARARAAAQTAVRILDVFEHRMREAWYDEITLEQVAREAGVAVPTIIRRFGGKEGLLEAAWERLNSSVEARRSVAPGDVANAVRVIVADYEVLGDLIIRALGQEDRFPALKLVNDRGRAFHRAWIAAAFAPWLDALAVADRRRRLDALVVATDVYVWKLVRRDMGRPVRQLGALMQQMIESLLDTDTAMEMKRA